MRIVTALWAVLLVAGCARSADSPPPRITPIPPARSTAAAPSAAPSATPPTAAPADVPQAGAPMEAVLAWVGEGRPADAGAFGTVTSDGVAEALPAGAVAFTVAAAGVRCMSALLPTEAGLSCLATLAEPPPRPARGGEGTWIGGWVDFSGDELTVGGFHGDPGRFRLGDGPALPAGATLRFGDYRCRAGSAEVVCVHDAHRTGVQVSGAGVAPFGCLTAVEPPASGVGLQYRC
ncbi:hypothetical protein LV457_13910 [Mycobacterium sp. MYCO198283]|uniref:hypothetical protein n=1 Tax=Mycobacterium sp. MYCO198283 TaxID=2883505 RepID=UPI001E4456A4|nr:hypothetical protein [Mycobacterium sp. MYCO198283]MCG5433373.1 hypothetical protein [Mycobacterium sp. MYCO198283]